MVAAASYEARKFGVRSAIPMASAVRLCPHLIIVKRRTVTIKVRYSDVTTITHSHSRRPATRDGEDIAQRGATPLERTEAASRPVRLLGVSVHNLEDPAAPFEPEEPLLPFESQVD